MGMEVAECHDNNSDSGGSEIMATVTTDHKCIRG